MIVWSGRGYFSILVLVLSLFIAFKILPETQKDLGFALSCAITGIFSWVMGNRWNAARRTMVNKHTGEEMVLKGNHSLFWIKLQYWGYIFSALAIVFLVKNFLE